MRALVLLVATVAAPVPKEKEPTPAEKLTGTWTFTSVKIGGADLFDSPGTGNQRVTFTEKAAREFLASGKTLAEGEFKLVAAKDGVLHFDWPRSVLVRPPGAPAKVQTVVLAAIARFDGPDALSVCYFDPDVVVPGTKRPTEFASTATNSAILCTLKRLPADKKP